MTTATKTKQPAVIVATQVEPTANTPAMALEKMLAKLTGEQRSILARIQTGATLRRDPRPGYLRENGEGYNEWPITTAAPFTSRYVRAVAVESMIAAGLLVSADTFLWSINPHIVAAMAAPIAARCKEPIAAAEFDETPATMLSTFGDAHPSVEEPIAVAGIVAEEPIVAEVAEPSAAAKTAKIGKLLNNAAKVRKAAKS